eukprot:g12494.t1
MGEGLTAWIASSFRHIGGSFGRRSLESDGMTEEEMEEEKAEKAYTPVGCYADEIEDRVLGHLMKSPNMTTEMCSGHCYERRATYMATQFGYECWCSRNPGLNFIRHTVAAEGDTGLCDKDCYGDARETCGGFKAFNLYKIEEPIEPDSDEYVGCFADDKEDRVMTHEIRGEDDMTQAVCRAHCEAFDSPFYATQYGDECWCGRSDDVMDYQRHGPGVCLAACRGDPAIACGGHDAFTLYEYKDDVVEETAAPCTGEEPEEGPMCSNGIPGIESKGACCVAECGQCGGVGCSTVGKSLGLGSDHCCEGTILENNRPCGDAPCVIGGGTKPVPTTTPTPTPTEMKMPVAMPTEMPTKMPVVMPMEMPVVTPTEMPTEMPVVTPTEMPVVTPTEMPAEMPVEDKTCSNGVPGIESSKGACCPAECGQCGGVGCSTVAKLLGLGSAECCEGTILANNKPCGQAPCVIANGTKQVPAAPTETPAPTPAPTEKPVEMPLPTDEAAPLVPPAPTTSGGKAPWAPKVGDTWQYNLGFPVDTHIPATVYFLDMDGPQINFDRLKSSETRIACYINVGTMERGRADMESFPFEAVGSNDYIDFTHSGVRDIMEARVQRAVELGCDAIEPDFMDTYYLETGFDLTVENQIAYNTWFAEMVHDYGMKVGLKNAVDLMDATSDLYDFAVTEDCFEYGTCDSYTEPFLNKGKPVFSVEYTKDYSVCAKANELGIDTILKNLDLASPLCSCSDSSRDFMCEDIIEGGTSPLPEPTPTPTPEPVEPAPAPTERGGGGSEGGGDDPGDYIEYLARHNQIRCMHGTNAVKWSNELASFAAGWAAEVATTHCGQMLHSGSRDYGENIYLCWEKTDCATAKGVMTGWYDDEVTSKPYEGHATAILWSSTTEIGCAEASCVQGDTSYTFVTCNYNPPGNDGMTDTFVLPPVETAETCGYDGTRGV